MYCHTLSLHDALPIYSSILGDRGAGSNTHMEPPVEGHEVCAVKVRQVLRQALSDFLPACANGRDDLLLVVRRGDTQGRQVLGHLRLIKCQRKDEKSRSEEHTSELQ